jgi:hypothetical protein
MVISRVLLLEKAEVLGVPETAWLLGMDMEGKQGVR